MDSAPTNENGDIRHMGDVVFNENVVVYDKNNGEIIK